MSLGSSLRLPAVLLYSLTLVTACSSGGDPSVTFTGGNNTNVTTATTTTTAGTGDTDDTDETGGTDGTEDPTTGEPTTDGPTTDPTTDNPTTDPTTTTDNPTTDPTTTTDDPTTTTDDPTTTTDDPTTTTTTTEDPIQCGNNQLDPGEPCDGSMFEGGLTCQNLGYDNGQLSCDNCTIDDSTCSNAAQPGTGQYSHCLEADDCFGFSGSYGCVAIVDENMNPEDGICTAIGCTSNSQCPAPPGGTATPVCESIFPDNGCMLDCTGNKTCPGGMLCYNVNPLGYRCF